MRAQRAGFDLNRSSFELQGGVAFSGAFTSGTRRLQTDAFNKAPHRWRNVRLVEDRLARDRKLPGGISISSQ